MKSLSQGLFEAVRTPQNILNLLDLHILSQIIFTAIKFKIFDVIGASQKSVKQIANEIKCDPTLASVLLNSLSNIGFLHKYKFVQKNKPEISKYLITTNKEFITDFYYRSNVQLAWSNLPLILQTGKPFLDENIDSRSAEFIEIWIASNHQKGVLEAQKLIKLINFSNVSSGGSGAQTFEFLKAYPKIRGAVLDMKSVLVETQKQLKKEEKGLEKRVELIEADFTKESFEQTFDCIFICDTMRMVSLEKNINLFKKCGKALNKGGKLIIVDEMVDDERKTTLAGLLFSLHMKIMTADGDIQSEKEIRELMEKAGIKYEKKVNISGNRWLFEGIKI